MPSGITARHSASSEPQVVDAGLRARRGPRRPRAPRRAGSWSASSLEPARVIASSVTASATGGPTRIDHLAPGPSASAAHCAELGGRAAAHLLVAAWSARARRPPRDRRARRRCRQASSASRDGASKKTSVAGTAFSSASRVRRALSGAAAGSPRTGRRRSAAPRVASAASTAEAPGKLITGCAGRDRLAHELVAGVGDQRRAGVADRWRPTCPPPARPARAAARARRCARDRAASAARCRIVGEQHAAVARVLAVDEVGAGQHRQRPQRDVGEIADRRGDEIEPGRQRLRQQPAQHLAGALRHARRTAVPELLACRHLPASL